MGGGDVGEGYGGYSFKLDDDVAVFLDAFDSAFDACEVSFSDDDASAYFVGYIGVVEEHDAVVGDGGNAYEVLHFPFGYMDDLWSDGWVKGTCHHVSQRAEVVFGHLQTCECVACGMDKEQVVNGWHLFKVAMAVALYQFGLDGKECFDVELVETGFHFQFAVVGDTHGKPVQFVAVIAHR